MAIAFVNSAEVGNNGGSSNSLTTSYTVTAGSTLLFISFLGDNVGGNDDITSVTYAGANAVLWLKDTAGGAQNRIKYTYVVKNPTSGANNIVINCTNSHYLIPGVSEYKGTATSGPDATQTTNAGGGGTSVTGSITPISNNAWVFAFVEYNDGASDPPGAGTGATRRSFGSAFFNWGIYDSNGPITPPASYSMTATCPAAVTIAFIMDQVAFAPPFVEWGGDAPNRPVRRKPWRSSPKQDDFIGIPANPVFVEWGDELRGRQARRVPWRAKILDPNEFINNPTQFPAPPWVQDPDPPPRHRVAWRARPQPLIEDWLGIPQLVGVPWAFEEEQHKQQRRVAWRARPQPLYEEFLNNPTQFPAPPWVQDPDPPPRRRVAWRARPQPDDTSGFPFTTGIIVYVEWGDELRGRQIRRSWYPRGQEDFIVIPLQPPWGWEPDQSRTPRRLRSVRAQPDDLVIVPAAAAVVYVEWGDEPRGRQIRRVSWRSTTLNPDEWFLPFFPPQPPSPPATPLGPSYEIQYDILVSAYNTGQLTVQQFYYALYKLQWAFSGAVDWNTSFRPRAAPGDLPPQPIKPFLPTQMITNQADTVVDAATLINTARSLLSLGCPPSAFPAPYPPRWAFQFYGGR